MVRSSFEPVPFVTYYHFMQQSTTTPRASAKLKFRTALTLALGLSFSLTCSAYADLCADEEYPGEREKHESERKRNYAEKMYKANLRSRGIDPNANSYA